MIVLVNAWHYQGPILAAKHGGQAQLKRGYCRIFLTRPEFLSERLPCTGGGIWEPCPDRQLCEANRHRPQRRQVRQPGEGPHYYLAVRPSAFDPE